MNKTVAKIFKELKRDDFALYFHYGIDNEKEVWSKICKNIPAESNQYYLKTSICMIKFVIRKHRYIDNKKNTLDSLKNKGESLVSKTRVFAGFSFEKDLGGYTVWHSSKLISSTLKDYYEIKYQKDIRDKWNEIKEHLFTTDGNTPSLVYKFIKPHVYFMKNPRNNLIKIGVSIHPNIRKKQLESKNNKLEILRIIDSGGFELERELHEKFKQYRMQGEWFKSNEDILSFINN
ncbi:MAG: GIY-YIG nuclease family protein [Putridiphycobacter sp.]